MKIVAEVISVSRSNLADRLQERFKKRIGRPPLPDEELVSKIKAVIAELATYGYRRVHAILKRQALTAGLKPPNHKRVYRVMKAHGLPLDVRRPARSFLESYRVSPASGRLGRYCVRRLPLRYPRP